MQIIIDNFLKELEQQGLDNDCHTGDRSHKMLNITRDTGEFFRILVKSTDAKSILEIGTSNGYSTIWLASSFNSEDSKITTVEISTYKTELARENFHKAGLLDRIVQIQAGAAEYFSKCSQQYDILFLDAERVEYMSFIDGIETAIKVGGLLIVDNALSHPEELEEFINHINSCGRYATTTATVGKGEFLAYKISN